MSCCPKISLETCVWFAYAKKRNIIVSGIAGLIFFTGWWFIIYAEVMYRSSIEGAHLCGLASTLSLIIVNSISDAQVRGVTYSGDGAGARAARVWLFIGFVIGFASLLGASGNLFIPNKTHSLWPGLCVLSQNALIFASSLILKFGRTEDFWL